MIIKTLPYPPSINHYYSRQRNGAVYIGQEGKSYRNAVKNNMWKTEPIKGKVKVHIDVFAPDKRRRDLDNINKCLLDSIQDSGMIQDDYDIDHLSMWRREPVAGGKVNVIIKPMADFISEIEKEKKISWEEHAKSLVNKNMIDLEISSLKESVRSLENIRSKLYA